MATIGLTTRDVARELARRYSTMTHEELDVLEGIYKNGKELTEYMATEDNIVMSIESLFTDKPSTQQMVALEPTILFALPKRELEHEAVRNVNIQMLYRKILEESLIISQIHADMLRFESAGTLFETRQAFAAVGVACTAGLYCQLSADDS